MWQAYVLRPEGFQQLGNMQEAGAQVGGQGF
jgi:hypothetical protein